MEWNKKSRTENMKMNKTKNLVEFDTVLDEGPFFLSNGRKIKVMGGVRDRGRVSGRLGVGERSGNCCCLGSNRSI